MHDPQPARSPIAEPDDDDAEQVVQAIYEFANDQLDEGKEPHEVEALLIRRKLDPESATTVVRELVENRISNERRIAGKNIRYGLPSAQSQVLRDYQHSTRRVHSHAAQETSLAIER